MRKLSTLILKARIGNFLADWSGVAAVEFAYLAPLLMLMTFGTFEMARALIVQKRFQRAASMVGDLVTREDQDVPLGATASAARSTLSGMMISAQHVMQPYSSTPLTINVYQLWASPTDKTQTKIEWAYKYPTNTSSGCGNLKSMPASGMLATNGRADRHRGDVSIYAAADEHHSRPCPSDELVGHDDIFAPQRPHRLFHSFIEQ